MPVTFHLEGRTFSLSREEGRTVLELARAAGYPIEARCGGKGTCGRCVVLLGPGRYRIYGRKVEIPAGQRREVLACQTEVLGEEAEIFLPSTSVIRQSGARILDEAEIPPHPHRPVAPEGYGLAVDIGTTTAVVALADLAGDRIVSRESLYNQQILEADDVVSRILIAGEPDGLERLRELVVRHTIDPLLHRLCSRVGVPLSEIRQVCIAGNTVMEHIFFGISPASIGTLPYEPATRTFRAEAGEIGLDLPPATPVVGVPAIAGYVGGDITADLLVSNLARREGLSVLVDIGTNGEMVAALDGEMTACATAAGPAFEGAGILHGVRAAEGAVDSVTFGSDLDIRYTVIGDGKPVGLCGTAIIDFVACALRAELINFIGRYDVERLKAAGRYAEVCGIHACVVVPAEESGTGEPVLVTEQDIAELLKAKAAIYAGLKTLLAQLDRTPKEIDRLLLAGGFARHLNLENAVTIGLLPDLPAERFEIIGNGALAGAALLLLDRDAEQVALELIDRPRVLTLNQTPWFTDFFHEALALPYLDPGEFPRVAATR